MFYYLARDPARYQKLRSAVLKESGSLISPGHAGLAKLRACEYLQNCINEALRLGRPTPVTARQAIWDTRLPKGGGIDGEAPIFILKGTPVVLNIFKLHHRQDIWGNDVEQFRPERWENRQRTWEFIPFGGGTRACIGRTYPFVQHTKYTVNVINLCRAICEKRALLRYGSLGSVIRPSRTP